ncbi:MAG: hypothetical protein HY263_04170 [Chloroflexi bacterium]|nr:hypothetical protein [Chloroflexota bacterium]
MDPSTAAGSGAGLGFLLALLNGWLAGRRNRSSLLWFLGSLVLSPVALLLTIYLLAQPRATPGEDRKVGIAAVAVWAVLIIMLLSLFLAGTPVGTGAGRA